MARGSARNPAVFQDGLPGHSHGPLEWGSVFQQKIILANLAPCAAVVNAAVPAPVFKNDMLICDRDERLA